MSTKMESKQRTPSVIARLMGLDEPLPQQPVQRKHRVLSEHYLKKVASIGVREKRSFHEHHLFRWSIEEQREFNDVFDVSETLERDKLGNLSVEKGKANSSSSEVKMEFLSHTFVDAKCISVDMRLQPLKEYRHALGVLDSKRDHFLKYLNEPDSLLTKHVHDLQDVPHPSQSRDITVVKSSCASECRNTNICRKFGRQPEQGNVNSLRKLENDLITDFHGEPSIDNIHKFSRSRVESNNEACRPRTRIVVLKPNLGQAENDAKCFSSPSSYKVSHADDRKHEELLSPENENVLVEVKERKNLADDMEPIRHRSRVREIEKGMSRNTRHGISSISNGVSRSGRDVGTFAKVSELIIRSSPNFSDRNNGYQSSSCHSDGSYVASEAKKQISERWKLTKKFQEVGLASSKRSRTLGEMLALLDHESMPRNLGYKLGEHGLGNQIGTDEGDLNLGTPLGISSRDGWKNGCVRGLSVSTSLPACSTAIGSPKTRTHQKSPRSGQRGRPSESLNKLQLKSKKQDLNQKGGLEPTNSGSSCIESHSVPCSDSENNPVQDNYVIQDELKNRLEEEDPSEQNPMVFKSSSCSVLGSNLESSLAVCETLGTQEEQKDKLKDTSVVLESSITSVATVSMVADVVADAETEVGCMSFGKHEQQLVEPMDCSLLLKDNDSFSHVPETSFQQDISIGISEEGSVSSYCSGADPEFLMNLEEAYQPSPVSVLEPPFKEEISSSDCFQNVNANLRGLKLQLELLKSELSEAYSEEPGMVVSSDEDAEEGSEGNSEDNEDIVRLFRVEESRDFSYLVDVLNEAGFPGRNPGMGLHTWHSPECPISLSVFEILEKKYGEQTSWKRSERRLLFDRINSGLMEILQLHMGVPIWTKPVSRRLSFSQSLEVIEEELWMLLASHEKVASNYSSEKVLGKDDGWLELGDDIEIIGREIESLLIDELAAEVISIKSF